MRQEIGQFDLTVIYNPENVKGLGHLQQILNRQNRMHLRIYAYSDGSRIPHREEAHPLGNGTSTLQFPPETPKSAIQKKYDKWIPTIQSWHTYSYLFHLSKSQSLGKPEERNSLIYSLLITNLETGPYTLDTLSQIEILSWQIRQICQLCVICAKLY